LFLKYSKEKRIKIYAIYFCIIYYSAFGQSSLNAENVDSGHTIKMKPMKLFRPTEIFKYHVNV